MFNYKMNFCCSFVYMQVRQEQTTKTYHETGISCLSISYFCLICMKIILIHKTELYLENKSRKNLLKEKKIIKKTS